MPSISKKELLSQLNELKAELKEAREALADRDARDARRARSAQEAREVQDAREARRARDVPEAKEPGHDDRDFNEAPQDDTSYSNQDLEALLSNLNLQSNKQADHNLRIRDINTLRSEKFNDENWMTWSLETKAILDLHELWLGVVISPDITQYNFSKKNLQACLIITSGLEQHIASQVRSFKFAYQIWKFLKPKECIHMIHTKRQQLMNIRIDCFKNASQYLGKAKTIFDELNSMATTSIPEQDLIQALLNGLRSARGNPYQRLIERMDERYREGNVDTYTFPWFRRELLAKERFIRDNKPWRTPQDDSGTAYINEEDPQEDDVTCYKCGKRGHYADQCRSRRRREPSTGGQRRGADRRNRDQSSKIRGGTKGNEAINLMTCIVTDDLLSNVEDDDSEMSEEVCDPFRETHHGSSIQGVLYSLQQATRSREEEFLNFQL